MWRTSNTNCHLENHTDIETYRSFLNIYTCLKGIYTTEKKMSQLLLPPRKTSGVRNGSNLVDQDHMEMPNTPGDCQGNWLRSTTFGSGPVAEDNTHLCQHTWRSPAGTELKALPLLASVYGTVYTLHTNGESFSVAAR